MARAGAALALILALAAVPARADDPASTIVSDLAVTAKPRTTALSGVEVAQPKVCLPPRNPPTKGVPAPKLVSTYPASGQVVRPGLMVLTLNFDLPMACAGSLGLLGADPCSARAVEKWVVSFDRKTLRVLCWVKPGMRYIVWVNRNDPEDFQGLSGHKPEPSELSFSVSNEAPVSTTEEAVALAGGGGRGKPQDAP